MGNVRGRLLLGVATAIASVAGVVALLVALGAPAVAGDDDRLLPDLVTMRIAPKGQLELDRDKGRARLLLDNTVGNRGDGPLQISAAPNDGTNAGEFACKPGDYLARQEIYADANGDGHFDREGQDGQAEPARQPFGCMNFHPKEGHMHWHVINFTIYELLDWRTRETVAQVRKQGFCLLDGATAFAGLPGTPDPGYFSGAGCGFSPDQAPELEGISVGWSDVYGRYLPGQAINITGVNAGRYCLSSKVDPLGKLAETNEENNAHLTPIRIEPKAERVVRLPGSCPAN